MGDLSLGYSPRNVRLYERAEADAHKLMEAAEAFGHSRYPPLPGWLSKRGQSKDEAQRAYDRWWIEVMGDTERDLEEYQVTLAREYRRARRRLRWRHARGLKERYINVDAMLTVGHGLSIRWY